MWFEKDAIDCMSRTKTCCCDNLTWKGYVLVPIVHLYQLCCVPKLDWSDLIICVEFKNIDGRELEGLVSDADLVISESPSS